MRYFEFDRPRGHIIASDGLRIYRIQPGDSSHQVICETASWHEVSSIDVETGSIVYKHMGVHGILQFDWADADTGDVTEDILSNNLREFVFC